MTVIFHFEANLIDVEGHGFEYDFSNKSIIGIPYIWCEEGVWKYPISGRIPYTDLTIYDRILIEEKTKLLELETVSEFEVLGEQYHSGIDMDIFLQNRRKEYQAEAIGAIFDDFSFYLSKIAIDKNGNRRYIEAQTKVYENMYQLALDGIYDTAKNDAIIRQNKAGRAFIAPILDAMNVARANLFSANESGVVLYDIIRELEGAALTKDMIIDGSAIAYLASLQQRIGGASYV